jgi:hypothetical protein
MEIDMSILPENPPSDKAQVVILVLIAEGAGPPTVVRARRALKALHRAYRLRCVLCYLPKDDAPAPLTPAARAAFYREQFPAVAAENGGGK